VRISRRNYYRGDIINDVKIISVSSLNVENVRYNAQNQIVCVRFLNSTFST